MPITTLSKEGLSVIAIMVALLWGCLGMERLSVRQANHEYRRAVYQMRALHAGRPAAAAHRQENPVPAVKQSATTSHYRI